MADRRFDCSFYSPDCGIAVESAIAIPKAVTRGEERFAKGRHQITGIEKRIKFSVTRPDIEIVLESRLLRIKQGPSLGAQNRAHSYSGPVVDYELSRFRGG